MKHLFLLFCLWSAPLVFAQEYFPKNDGVSHNNSNYIAFTNATIYVSPEKVLQNGTLLIHKGRVVDTGTNVPLPENCITIPLDGKYVYPAFIDIYSDFGVEKPKRTARRGRSPQYDATRSGYYWNDHIMPDVNAFEKFTFDSKEAKKLRESGFGAVNTHHQDGIARGTGMLVTLAEENRTNERIVKEKSSQHFSFSRSVAKTQSYPGSVMGTMALLRQLYHDAEWYAAGNSKTKDLALEALLAQRDLPAIIEAKDKLHSLRADKISDQFDLNYIILGGGYEYEAIEEIKATQATFILPLDFPEAYDVSNPYQAAHISLSSMRRWNQAPANPAIFAENNIPFAFTTHGLKKPDDLLKNIQKAIRYGLSEKTALEALTTVPAKLLQTKDLGNLQDGALANFLITSGPIFQQDTEIFENWTQGHRTILKDMTQKDLRGTYEIATNGKEFILNLTGKPTRPKASVTLDTTSLESDFSYTKNWVTLTVKEESNTYRMTAAIQKASENFSGKLLLPDGNESQFTAIKTKDYTEEDTEDKESEQDNAETTVPITFPNMAYGNTTLPKQETILFKNATVWTGEEAGILETTDVLIQDGKIKKIGKNLRAGKAKVVDATGKHLTAGIIDEHSHLALTSVNEGGHNSSAEVQMEDVVDPDDIGIYRALAGGVTSAQLLHGSANPIGGQSAIVKFKWGANADAMIYDNSPKFIKFALGENVKQSNWGAVETVRFPQTRMGVEQVFTDYFQRAREYEQNKQNNDNYRYDEEMETLLEILKGERFISCHSYVQSEINMLMKVAEKFDFTINTFTHILEGYKVADKMKEHGVKGASTFSDWWAYKFEVNDAIPYNAAIMHDAGLNVSINSDDGEMIRRLNQEAGKTIKYGGVPEYEAWKMVTINPAKMLHIDDRVGSIKEGKDADVVLWNDNPLSVYSKAEKTLIEGVVYFDIEDDKEKRKAIQEERNKLMQLLLDVKNGGGKTQPPKRKEERDFHCDTDHLETTFYYHD